MRGDADEMFPVAVEAARDIDVDDPLILRLGDDVSFALLEALIEAHLNRAGDGKLRGAGAEPERAVFGHDAAAHDGAGAKRSLVEAGLAAFAGVGGIDEQCAAGFDVGIYFGFGIERIHAADVEVGLIEISAGEAFGLTVTFSLHENIDALAGPAAGREIGIDLD